MLKMKLIIDGQKRDGVFDHSKPPIPFGPYLTEYGDEFFKYAVETQDMPTDGTLIAHIANDTSPTYCTIEWDLCIEERKNIECPFNLDSIITYMTPITGPIDVVFAALECVRRYIGSEDVVLANNGDRTDVYFMRQRLSNSQTLPKRVFVHRMSHDDARDLKTPL